MQFPAKQCTQFGWCYIFRTMQFTNKLWTIYPKLCFTRRSFRLSVQFEQYVIDYFFYIHWKQRKSNRWSNILISTFLQYKRKHFFFKCRVFAWGCYCNNKDLVVLTIRKLYKQQCIIWRRWWFLLGGRKATSYLLVQLFWKLEFQFISFANHLRCIFYRHLQFDTFKQYNIFRKLWGLWSKLCIKLQQFFVYLNS